MGGSTESVKIEEKPFKFEVDAKVSALHEGAARLGVIASREVTYDGNQYSIKDGDFSWTVFEKDVTLVP